MEELKVIEQPTCIVSLVFGFIQLTALYKSFHYYYCLHIPTRVHMTRNDIAPCVHMTRTDIAPCVHNAKCMICTHNTSKETKLKNIISTCLKDKKIRCEMVKYSFFEITR